MEAKNFKHTVRNRFENFSSPAPEAVWQGIEANLDANRRKSGILWWTFALIALFGFGRSLIISDHASFNFNSANSNAPKVLVSQEKDPVGTNYEEVKKMDPSSTQPPNNQATSTNLRNEKFQKIDGESNSPKKSIKSLKEKTAAEKSIDPEIDAPKRLTPLEIDELVFNQLDIFPCGTRRYVPRRLHYLGFEFSRFINLGTVRGNNEPGAASINSSPLASNESEYAFQRQIEIEAFYKTKMEHTLSSFMASLLYARSTSSFNNDSVSVTAKSNNIGIGIGYERKLRNGRFQLHCFGVARAELSFGRFSDFNNINPTPTTITPNLDSQTVGGTNFTQGLISGELGLRADYRISSRLNVQASIGYRSYFMQQQVNAGPISRIPQLFRVGLGCNFQL